MCVYKVSVCVCVQENRALSLQRHHHVTDPFIKRLGLEAELQVSIITCVCVCVCCPTLSVSLCVVSGSLRVCELSGME